MLSYYILNDVVWDKSDFFLFQVCSTPGNESVIYSLSWAPGKLSCAC